MLPWNNSGRVGSTFPSIYQLLFLFVLIGFVSQSVIAAAPISFGQTVISSIGSEGETDEYTFSANAADSVLIGVAKASGSLCPYVSLYNPEGVELANVWGIGTSEILQALPSDGEYTILVRDHFVGRTGGYGLVLERLNNPGNTVGIEFGETVIASIDPAGDLNLHTFFGNAGDSVLIDVNNVSGGLTPDVSLYSPEGAELASIYVGFTGPSEILQTLPADGQYTIFVREHFHGSYTGVYELSLNKLISEQLILGDPYTALISIGRLHRYYVEVKTGKNLLVTLESNSPTAVLELYGQYGQSPTQSDSDYVSKNRNIFGCYELLISPTATGMYYFCVYGRNVDGTTSYRITAEIVEQHISDIYPRKVINSSQVSIHVMGLGFTNGMQIELEGAGGANIQASTVINSSPQMIIAQFDLSSAALGLYDMSITWPDSSGMNIDNAVEVCPLPVGALYSFDLDLAHDQVWSYNITVPSGCNNLFVTLQKSTLVGYGYSWGSTLTLKHGEQQIASESSSHDLILQVTEPVAGAYTIEVTANQAGRGILTLWDKLPELPMGQWVVGKVYCSYGSTWYQIDLPPEQDKLCLDAEAMGLWSHFDIYYSRYGSSKRWASRDGTQTSIEIPSPAAGTYIVEFTDSAMLCDNSHWSEDQSRDVMIKANTTSTTESTLNYLPTITSLSTDKGGNVGLVTVKIKGGWLDPNATVSLVHSGFEDIIAQNISGDPDGTTLTATFDLTEKEPGQYNLIVINPDGQLAAAPGPFTIEQGGEPELWMEIVGREQMRLGREQTYVLRYGNLGTIDAKDVVIYISTSTLELIRVEREDGVVLIDSITNESFSEPALVCLPTLRSSEVRTLKVTIYTESPGTAIIVWIGVGIGVDFIGDVIWNTYKHMWEPVGDEQTLNQAFWECFRKGWDDTLEEWKGGEVPLWSTIKNTGERLLRDSILGPFMIAYKLGEFFYNWAVHTLEGLYLNAVEQQEKSKDIEPVHATTPEDKYGPTGFDSPGTVPEECKRFVTPDREFYYRADFWNREDATAPACDVLVKDQLDPNLDVSSFRFEEMGFRKWTVKLEPCQYFNINIDMRPDANMVVNVEGTFDEQTREITWTFRSLDPATWQTPEDLMAGFLPPITESGEEVGWTGFSAKAKGGLGTGAKIRNQAFVEFDWAGDLLNHPAPKEGPWLNTIDAGVPESHVLALPAAVSDKFTVQWMGQDDVGGSGINSYDIYVSMDDGPYEVWLDDTSQTSASFAADCNNSHTYAFYSVARDNVGHVENPPSEADAITMVRPVRVGDISGDGKVTAYDAALAAQCAEGSTTLSAAQRMAADVTGDGCISYCDALLIARYAVGLIDSFPVERVRRLPDQTTVCGCLFYGDINQDNKITIQDVLAAINCTLCSGELSDLQRIAADVDGNGWITIEDIALMIMHISNEMACFPTDEKGRLYDHVPVCGIGYGDFDGSCRVDFADLVLLAARWMNANCGICGGADFTDDGNVDLRDISVFAENWLMSPE